MKASADRKKRDSKKKKKFVSIREENFVGEGENVCYHHFLLFSYTTIFSFSHNVYKSFHFQLVIESKYYAVKTLNSLPNEKILD